MGFCKFTKSGRPAPVSGDRKSLSLRGVPQGHLLRGAQRRGNPFFSCKETDSHASDAVTGVGMTGSGTSGRRPLRGAAVIRNVEDAVPYNGSPHPSAGGDAHSTPSDKCAFCGGTHGSRPTGYAGHAGRDVEDAVPYNGSSHPSAGGRCPHIAPPIFVTEQAL